MKLTGCKQIRKFFHFWGIVLLKKSWACIKSCNFHKEVIILDTRFTCGLRRKTSEGSQWPRGQCTRGSGRLAEKSNMVQPRSFTHSQFRAITKPPCRISSLQWASASPSPFLHLEVFIAIHLFHHYILGVTREDILFHRSQWVSHHYWHVGPDSSRVGMVLSCVLYNFSSIPSLYPQHISSIFLLPSCDNKKFL